MPAKMTTQPTTGNTQSRTVPSRTSNSSHNDDSGSGAEIAGRRRLQKTGPTVGQPSGHTPRAPSIPRSVTDPRTNVVGKRRQSIREQTAPGPGMPRSGSLHFGNSSINQQNEYTRNLSISSSNSHLGPGPSHIGNSTKYDLNQTPPEGPGFLAPITFDDFHNSIMDEPSLNHFPMPGHGGAGYGHMPATLKSNNPWRNEAAVPVRSSRSNSVRRQSDVSPLTGHTPSTNASMPPPGAPASRARRQSQVPPPSSSSVSSRPPRKSIGPGTLMTDPSDDAPPRRRVSLSTRKTSMDNTRTDPSIRLRARHLDPQRADNGKVPANSRYLKAKSLQPPSREQQPAEDLLSPSGADHSRSSSTNGLHTPVKNAAGGANTPSSTKRMSMMPHATGLGARTISPTDARRMKRISMMPQAPPMPITPPTQNPPDLSIFRPRSSAQSPSMIPRKSETPSSSRTTPDPNRKSYSSGISLSSNTSYNSTRNSSGSFQPRLSQTFSSSRLPTPKPRVESMNNAPEEEVPPVPAIPKAFESPKTDVDLSIPATVRKSSLPFEIGRLSVDSRRDSDSSAPAANASEDPMPAGSHTRGPKTPDAKGKQSASLAKKSLQPLKLPPFNLLPLSTPMAAKIDALKDTAIADEVQANTPPPRMNVPKTPSTPMTASKASFFFNSDELDVEPIQFPRSRTSHFLVNMSDSSGYRAPSSSSAIVPLEMPSTNRNISPYISSSLPKTGGDFHFMREKASGDYSQSSVQLGKLTGPRPQTQSSAFSSNPEGGSRMSSTPDHEKSGNTANLTLRHSVSKPQLASDTEGNTSRYDNMPPPRLPASATWNGLSSVSSRTSPALKPAYLIARRKSSISSLPSTINTRQPPLASDQSLGLTQSPTTGDSSGETDNLVQARPASSILSPVHKILNSAKSNVASKPRSMDPNMDPGEFAADEEMRRLGSKRRDFESAAKELDELRRRANAKERVSPAQALKMASLNIFERGEIIDFKDIYFCGTQKAKKHVGDLKSQSANFGYDDERGDYQIVIGDHLAYRYEVVDVLGKGSFGQVVRCVDHKTGGLVAVKIIRNKKRFHQQALVEVNILQKLREWDPNRQHSVVKFTQSFYFRGHLCISTELLGMNLYEFIKAHDFKGFSLKLVRQFTKQLLSTLVLLYSKKVIHCDLKPENILLAHPMRSEIKVIDFGSSCFEHEKVYTYIQSRFYRSPEVILGMSYGMPIDMWSVGCILAELITGYPIFPGENEQEQLACIMEVFGPPEKHLIDKSTRKKLFFDSMGKPRLTVSSKGRRRRPSSKDLKQVLKCDDDAFLDFIARCLRWDPARRLTPNDALNHEFITGIKLPSRPRGYLAGHNASAKRLTSHATTSAARPLPEPPGTTLKAGAPVKTRDTSSSSPVKSAPKRLSNVNGLQTAPGKRISNSGSYSNSSLPRAAARSASGKSDLAAAAAATSLKTR